MKPSTVANASFWATLALIILFTFGDSIFYGLGTLSLLVCLIFLHNTYAGKVARIYFIISFLLIAAFVVVILVSDIDINSLLNYEFPFTQSPEVEAFANLFRVA